MRTTLLNLAKSLPRVTALLLALILFWGIGATMATAKNYKVEVGTLNARSGPGTNYDKRGALGQGSIVKELERQGNWSKVQTESGDVVWVHNGYINVYETVSDSSAIDASAIRTQVQSGHTALVKSFSMSDDGRYMITNAQYGFGVDLVSEDSSDKLWQVQSGKLVRDVIRTSEDGLSRLSNDGSTIAIFKGKISGGFEKVEFTTIAGDAIPALSNIAGQPFGNIFSSDGNTVATFKPGSWVKVWDAHSGKQLAKWDDKGIMPAEGIRISNDHTSILVWSSVFADARTVLISNGKVIAKLSGDQKMMANYEFSPSGKYIYERPNFSAWKELRLWDSATGKIVFRHEAQGDEFSGFTWGRQDELIGLSYYLDASSDESIPTRGLPEIWDIRSSTIIAKAQLGQIPDFSRFPSDRIIDISQDGRYFITSRNSAIWELETGNLVTQLPDHPIWATFINGTSNVLSFYGDGRVQRHTGADWMPQMRYGNTLKPVLNAGWTTDGQHIFTKRLAEVVEDSIKTDEFKYTDYWDTALGAFRYQFGRTGLLAALDPNNEIDADDRRNFIRFVSPDLNFVITRRDWFDTGYVQLEDGQISGDMAPFADADSIDDNFTYLAKSHQVIVPLDGEIEGYLVWDIQTQKLVRRLKWPKNKSGLQNYSVAAGEKFVVGSIGDDPALVATWEIATGELVSQTTIKGFGEESTVKILAVAPDGKMAFVRGNFPTTFGYMLMDTTTGVVTKEFPYEAHPESPYFGPEKSALAGFSENGTLLAIAGSDGIGRVYDVFSGQLLYSLIGHQSTMTSIAWSGDGKRLISGSKDGTTRIWSSANGKELVKLMNFGNNEWIAITPDGFFNSSHNGAAFLSVIKGTEVLSVDNFFNALFRPDLVRQAFLGDPFGLVRQAAAESNLGQIWDSGLPPDVIQVASLDGLSVDADRVVVQVELEPRDGGIGRLEIRVNGATQVVDNLPKDTLETSLTIQQSIFLTPGSNDVQVVAYNKANLIASDPLSLNIESTAELREKPTLRVLAVGVDDYPEPRLVQLSYAVNDATSFASAIERVGSKIYDTVKVDMVLNEDATAEVLQRTFERIGAEAKPEDVFVLYLSGHGETKDGRYYFLPHDFEYDGPGSLATSAIGQQQWQQWLSLIPAQKSVLLYDTCESGSASREAIDEGTGLTAAIERLNRATGRTILTAATDTEPALEGYGGHGVFTYTVLEGLGVADADSDGQLEVTELASYIERELPKISYLAFNRRQIPTTSISGYSFSLGEPVLVLGDNAKPLQQ